MPWRILINKLTRKIMQMDIVHETSQYRFIRNYINGIKTIYVQDKQKEDRVYISGESLARFTGYNSLESMFLDDDVLDKLNDRWRVEGFFPIIIIDEATFLTKEPCHSDDSSHILRKTA